MPGRLDGPDCAAVANAIAYGRLMVPAKSPGPYRIRAVLGPSAWRYMFLIGVLPALSVLWIRTSVRDPDLWVAANERRQMARQRVVSGGAVSPDDHALIGFTVKQILSAPELRRRLLRLLVLSLSSIVAWWRLVPCVSALPAPTAFAT